MLTEIFGIALVLMFVLTFITLMRTIRQRDQLAEQAKTQRVMRIKFSIDGKIYLLIDTDQMAAYLEFMGGEMKHQFLTGQSNIMLEYADVTDGPNQLQMRSLRADLQGSSNRTN